MCLLPGSIHCVEQASREQQIMLPEQSEWLLQPFEHTASRTKSPRNLVHSVIIEKIHIKHKNVTLSEEITWFTPHLLQIKFSWI